MVTLKSAPETKKARDIKDTRASRHVRVSSSIRFRGHQRLEYRSESDASTFDQNVAIKQK